MFEKEDGGVDWIELAPKGNKWRVFVNFVLS
jgi:hypothetical protein